jgi:hypothetical protein
MAHPPEGLAVTQRSLTDVESAELDALTASVTSAIEARRQWLDAKMVECSSIKVGDMLYDLDSGLELGVVSELYRYWRDRDDGVRDTSAHCDYRFETSPFCFDNTSRQPEVRVGTAAQAAASLDARSQRLKGRP